MFVLTLLVPRVLQITHELKSSSQVFKKRVKLLNQNDIYPELKHIASTAAAINYPETSLDLVRTGVLIYGYWPTRETFIFFYKKERKKRIHCKEHYFGIHT